MNKLIFLLIFTAIFISNNCFAHGGHSVNVTSEEVDSIKIDGYYEDQLLLDSLTNDILNQHNKYKVVEQHQIEKYQVPIKLDSLNRVITLKNGKEFVLKPNYSKLEGGLSFIKPILNRYYVFRVQYYEGSGALLLDTETGNKTYVYGEKVFVSPDQKYFISINDDIEAGYSRNGFQLFEVDDQQNLTKIWKLDQLDWGPINIKWLDNDSFVVKEITYYPKYKTRHRKFQIR